MKPTKAPKAMTMTADFELACGRTGTTTGVAALGLMTGVYFMALITLPVGLPVHHFLRLFGKRGIYTLTPQGWAVRFDGSAPGETQQRFLKRG